jgi:multiple sugar transport system substrate-binding protein
MTRRFGMKSTRVILGTVASVALLAGACTAGGGTPTPSTTPTVNPTVSHAPVTITLWSFFTKPEINFLNAAITSFEQKYPWITVTSVPGKQDTDVLNAIHSGTAPDVGVIGVPDDSAEFCSSGAYVSLNPYVNADHINLKATVPSGPLTLTGYKGNQCMLPMLTDAYGLYYNTDMFAKAGITDPPKTYSELFADAKKLTQFNPDGSIKVAGFLPLATGDYELANFVNGVYSNAQWYGTDGKASLGTDPMFAELLQFTKSMTDWFGYDKLQRFFASNGGENTEFSPSNLFEHGKLAMDFDGEWRVAFIRDDKSKVPYATAPMAVADDQPQLYGVGQVGGTTIGIPRGSQHPAEAWLLVKYLALDVNAEKMLGEGLGNVPTVFGALSDPVLTNDPHFATFLKIVSNPNSRYKPITLIGTGDVTMYDQFVDKYLAGKMSDLRAGLQSTATQIDKQIELGQ